jgi:hypothetical protein
MSRVSLFAKPVWTPPEDAELRELTLSDQNVATIAANLKRRGKAVYGRAAKFGLSLNLEAKSSLDLL